MNRPSRLSAMLDPATKATHALDMPFDLHLGLISDDGTDVDAQAIGSANREFMQGGLQHRKRSVRDIVLKTQHTQSRAALTGAIERRRDDVCDNLLGERRRIHDHPVLPAGFRDERNRVTRRRQALRQLPLNQPGDLGRAGEHDTGRLRRAHQRGTQASISRRELKRGARHTCFVQNLHAFKCNNRRLLRRLRDNGISGSQRRRDLTRKDRQRKIPRTDTHDGPERHAGRSQCFAPPVLQGSAD